jgi:DNA-binding transcriptional LysR family regulator
MLDWDDLRFFLAVARAGTLSGAAHALGVTQPVGRRLAAFEKSLGAKLFTKAPSGHTPTATGTKLLSLAERMEADAIAVERVASGSDSGLKGQVRVTASEWMIDRVIAPPLGAFVARHPGLSIELLADARHLSLVRREADIAIRPSRFEHQEEVVESAVGVLGFGLYASDAYLAECGVPDFTRGCPGHRLIAMSEALTKVPDVDWLPSVAAEASVVARANGRIPTATLAAAGVGLACLPRFLGGVAPSLRRLVTPTPEPQRSLFVAIHRDGRGVPRIKATAAFLKDCLRRLQPALCGASA